MSDEIKSSKSAAVPSSSSQYQSFNIMSSISDPRSFRIHKLRQSNVMDLQIERFTQFNLNPTTTYEMYQGLLHAAEPSIKQAGVPGDEDQRDVDCNTEEITTSDKQMQFTYGDDTALYDAIEEVKNRKARGLGASKRTSTSTSTSTSTGTNTDGGASSSSSSVADSISRIGAAKFSNFLKRSVAVFECEKGTTEEDLHNHPDDGKVDRSAQHPDAAFDMSFNWVPFGGGNIIANRSTSVARFSYLQPNILITAHPYPDDDALNRRDARPYKVNFITIRLF